MNLEDIIYRRQSVRKYTNNTLSEECIESIKDIINNSKELNPDISWSYDIVDSSKVKTMMNWKSPHYIFMYSETSQNYLENIGFIFQQVDLYLQSHDIGSCWLGMASPKTLNHHPQDHEFIITMAFGKSNGNISRKSDEFKRKKLEDISDKKDEKLNVARLAPSATNSQPWYFTHDTDNSYNIYRKRQNIIKRRFLDKWNQVDIGIALAHIYVSNKNSFEFYVKDDYEKIDGHIYEGSFRI